MVTAPQVVIPARMQSTRLPGKPLADIAGKPMILYVADRAIQAVGAKNVTIATDHAGIAAISEAAGVAVVMTSPEHPSGTDRVAEVAAQRGWTGDEVIVNLQGDEPFMPPDLITTAIDALQGNESADLSTLAAAQPYDAIASNPNVVKAVVNQLGRALYFSRSPVPYGRDGATPDLLRHIGLYAYRASALLRLSSLPPTPAEEAEKLEQLRALEHGMSIQVCIVSGVPPHGIDTPADLAAARRLVETMA